MLGLFVSIAEAMSEELATVARDWQADLLVYEPTAFAGPLAAAAAGIPAVRHLYGTDLLSAAGRFLPDALAPLADKLGVTGVEPFGVATVDPCPGSLQVPTGSRRLAMRYLPYNGPGEPPAPLPAVDRPRVCVTWGTTLSRLHPDFFLAGKVARVLDGLDVEVVVAVAPGQRSMLGKLPEGTYVVEGTPLHLLFPYCDAVVGHGGAGTLLTGLSHGLPQVHVPRLPDHVRHSGRLAETGAGLVVPPGDDEGVAVAVSKVLGEAAFRKAAQGLASELRGQPTPAALVAELEHLV